MSAVYMAITTLEQSQKNTPGTRSSPRSLPAASTYCTFLTISPSPIPNTCLPSLGTTTLVHSSAVTTLINWPASIPLNDPYAPPCTSNGLGMGRRSAAGDTAGEAVRAELLTDRWTGFHPTPPPTYPLFDDPDEPELSRRALLELLEPEPEPERTPKPERPLSDMTCIASRTDAVPGSEMSGCSGKPAEGAVTASSNSGGCWAGLSETRCSMTVISASTSGSASARVSAMRCRPDAKSGKRLRRLVLAGYEV